MTTLLMCKPGYYGIEYEINHWMNVKRQADPELAARQWYELYDTLVRRVGLNVEVMEPAPGLPDLVFTANAGLVHGETFVPSHFRHEERSPEEEVFGAWFRSRGYKIIAIPSSLRFEGEGDAFVVGDSLFAGYPFRSDAPSHQVVAGMLGKEAVSLELVDPYFYHLDTCFCPLGEGGVMYYPGAFSDTSRRIIEARFPERIEVSEREARSFVCNAVVAGKAVVTSEGCPETGLMLAAQGYRVFPVNTSEFIKAGGSAKCLTLFIERDGGPSAVTAREQTTRSASDWRIQPT